MVIEGFQHIDKLGCDSYIAPDTPNLTDTATYTIKLAIRLCNVMLLQTRSDFWKLLLAEYELKDTFTFRFPTHPHRASSIECIFKGLQHLFLILCIKVAAEMLSLCLEINTRVTPPSSRVMATKSG